MKIPCPALPLHSSFFPSQLSRRFRAENIATLAIVILQLSWSMKNVEDECTKQFLKTVFEYKWSSH